MDTDTSFYNLYALLDSTSFFEETTLEEKSRFFFQAQGEFLRLLRNRNQLSETDVASCIDISAEQLKQVESGRSQLSSSHFYKLCLYLGAIEDVFTFMTKLEAAYRPELRKLK